MKRAVRLALSGFVLLLVLGAVRVWTMAAPLTADEANIRVYRGAVHVHSDASHDARQTVAQIAGAAKVDGLDFVILTDHDQPGAASERREGVLIIHGSELSLPDGHVLVLPGDLPPTDVRSGAELWPTLRKHNTVVAAAHPDSLKRGMSDATVNETEGYELLSASSDFYAALRQSAAALLLAYPLRPRLALTALYPDRARGAERYDRLLGQRQLRLFCGTDDHGWVKRPERLATYVTYLPTFIPTGDDQADGRTIIDLLGAGDSYCALGLYGDGSPLSVTVHSADGIASVGANVSLPATLSLRFSGPLPDGHEFLLYRDGALVARSPDAIWNVTLTDSGEYRVEVVRTVPTFFFGRRQVHWLYANPIFVRPAAV